MSRNSPAGSRSTRRPRFHSSRCRQGPRLAVRLGARNPTGCKFTCATVACACSRKLTHRYPLIVDEAARLKGTAILDAGGRPRGCRRNTRLRIVALGRTAVACAFDLLMLNGERLGRRVAAQECLSHIIFVRVAAFSTSNTNHDKMYEAARGSWPRGHRVKTNWSFYRSRPTKMWIKVKNPKAPAATRILDGTF